MDAILDTRLTPSQRLLSTWAFVALGLVIAVQLHIPPRWAKLTKETKPFWYSVYVLDVVLLLQASYPILLANMDGYAFGYEERLLNAVWLALLGVESVLVAGVVVQAAARRLRSGPKEKTL